MQGLNDDAPQPSKQSQKHRQKNPTDFLAGYLVSRQPSCTVAKPMLMPYAHATTPCCCILASFFGHWK